MRKLAICFLLLASIYAYGQEQTYEPHELALPLRSQAYQALGKEDFPGPSPCWNDGLRLILAIAGRGITLLVPTL